VLVVQTAFLGDVVLATSLFKGLRQLFPKVEVASLTLPETEPVVKDWVDRSFLIDKRTATDADWQRLANEIKSARFDLVLTPHRSYRTGLLLKRCGIPIRIGFNRGGGAFFMTHRVQYDRFAYEGARNTMLLQVLAPDSAFDPLPELPSDTAALDSARRTLVRLGLTEGDFVVLAPASVWTTKAWPTESYRELAQGLRDTYGIRSVIIGGPGDRDCGDAVALEPSLNLTGRLTPLEAAEVIRKSRLLVSGDSAPAHLATAVGACQVVIYGSTTQRYGFFPPTERARALGIDLWCRPCTDHGRKRCPQWGHLHCLRRITPQDVIETTAHWLMSPHQVDFGKQP